MKLTLQAVLSLLENVKGSGNQFNARCPSHDDQQNSLSVTEKEGRILLHCHAGCDFRDVCEALGIHPSQLFSESSATNFANPRMKSEIEAISDYVNEEGKLLFQVVRLKGKNFYNRQPLPNGEWENNLNGVRRVLYRLPKLLAKQADSANNQDFVYICEGEKDVETLERFGFLATCNPHGAGKWRDEYGEFLEGLNCVILPDNDEAGRNHALAVANSIKTKAMSVRLIKFQGLPEKGDVSDWFDKGHTAEELAVMAENAPLWQAENNLKAKNNFSSFSFTTLNDLLQEPDEDVAFVLENTLPVGGFSICSAKPKVGKSTMARNLAVCVSQGKTFLGRQTLKGKVLYLCLEEKREEVKRHFAAMNADSENILIHTGATPENAFQALAAAIAEYSPVLVIVDPLSRILRVRDFNDYGSVSRGLEPFIDLARKLATHIHALHHDGKGDRNGGDSLLGSTAFFAAVDCLIQMRKRDRGRTISSLNRYGEDIPETVILLDKETGFITAEGDLETVIQVEIQNEILEHIAEGEVLTEAEIKDRVNIGSKGKISKAIRVLTNEGKLIRTGKGGKSDPFLYSKPIGDADF